MPSSADNKSNHSAQERDPELDHERDPELRALMRRADQLLNQAKAPAKKTSSRFGTEAERKKRDKQERAAKRRSARAFKNLVANRRKGIVSPKAEAIANRVVRRIMREDSG